ncbi:hypothetical protein BN946_scf185008.g127 [Trametes cinnabarina]|uniref:Enhancer of polycomb-like N-terminal domain-containing protein n=1 Tax=Pycnoporus cinnabarinus TaxID=5643 RepID=A0A060SMC2_PYCCI|nr:hypothetical protein BN946_scf185008.g127 [Trametes cinnabarina]
MPRATHPGPAALRNRNRVTNKTRLKVIKDSLELDSIVLDEDEEKARVVSTAGVDAEDANEEHLQAVLSAATRHSTRSTRAADKEPPPTAYIPTPDSTGIVQNYEELYPPGRWKDPITYVKSSDTVEESISFALANGFIYYMDERDKEWLDKNNQEARGEGTSAQGAMSGTSTRSGRSAKAKGKEPDYVQPVAMTEDEFELVMSIFEKVTHEKTEFLHHVGSSVAGASARAKGSQGLEQGAPFPPFSDYQDTFASPLKSEMFAVFQVPDWVPPPPQMLRYARVVYPYWRERRLERGGHRIIPTVNLDETDTLNESYICFRRREIKATELGTALDLVRLVRQREDVKRDTQRQNQLVWERRRGFADLKRMHPSLGTKEDEELFMDKEKPPKKPRVEPSRPALKIRHPRESGDLASPTHPEPQIRPKEREAAIWNQIEQEMQQRKEKDKQWEDASDFPYQASPASYGARLFKFFPTPPSSASSVLSDDEIEPSRAIRLRRGRGGRILVDRRCSVKLRPAVFDETDRNQDDDLMKKFEERFRYDEDDVPAVGAAGPDEQDRKLIDESQPRHSVITMSLFTDQDFRLLLTDPSIHISTSEGRQQVIWPFQPAQPGHIPITRPPIPPPARQQSVPATASISNASASSSSAVNGTPVSVPTQVKKLATSTPLPSVRLSGAANRVPSGSVVTGGQPSGSAHSTPPSSATSNGFAEAQAAAAEKAGNAAKATGQSSPNGTAGPQDATNTTMAMAGARPMQWSMAGQRSPHALAADGTNGADGASLQMGAGSPPRAPSANGVRTPQLARAVPMPNANHAMNVGQGRASPANHIARLATPHSPSPHMLSPNMGVAQAANVHSSPTRAPQPAIPTPSPSLQTRQVVGGSGAAGY